MKARRYELTDKEWELVRPLIPISHTGRPQKDTDSRNNIFCKSRFDPQIAKTAVAAFANELRVMDHAPISIDLSQFFQKEICHDTSERNRRARSL